DLVGDRRLTREGRQTNSTYVYETLETIVATRTTAEWLEFCRRERIPAAEAVDLDDVIEGLPERDHPVAGRYRVVPPPVRFSRSPATVRSDAPLIGQHNREVLSEVGMSAEEIDDLESRGVLRTRGAADSMASARSVNPRLD
ncbi:MAG TPA: CoA transferase, partial [Acidimicrobiales bacterium]|nr:CoA transferase [Acidimicrobiales bacterium]